MSAKGVVEPVYVLEDGSLAKSSLDSGLSGLSTLAAVSWLLEWRFSQQRNQSVIRPNLGDRPIATQMIALALRKPVNW
jgi:hypothetical protein